VKYSIVTFGCRVNQADSCQIEEQLIAAGATASSPQDAHVIVVNTCSVTASADQAARQTVRKIARENPTARIVVTGCYATRRPDEIAALTDAVQIIPNTLKHQLAVEIGLTTAERFGTGDDACGTHFGPGLAGRTAYTLRVQTGCDQTCAYCIIPSTRGSGRSKSLDEVLSEIHRVREAGYREIALTGVHLGSYGRDLRGGTSLTGLLEAISDQSRGMRFRISSLEPMDCSEQIVELVARSTCFAPHFHLPLQHASDRILVAMRRPYTLAYYQRLTDRIRSAMPHASIGSDVIVGFPGETDDDFAILAAYLARSPLTHVHVFPYSDRPGTTAADLPLKVPGPAVRERARVVRDISGHLKRAFNRTQDGTVRPALTIDDGTIAVTDNYLKLQIPGGRARNELVNVRVKLAGENLSGEVL
jgi:threonylcarbamoyladenosine tRNA methylthiotransferase MtaB